MDERPAFSAPALEEWARLVEGTLRGLAHALNNRAAALSAAIELSDDPSEGGSVVSSLLEPELERVAELVSIVRTIGVPRPSEAFLPADASKDALAVLRIQPEHRERRFAFHGGDATPIRAPRWLFARALIALGALAARTSADVEMTATERGDWIELTVRDAREGSPYLTEAARAMGGERLSGASVGFRVPTLAAVRRREGRAG